MSSEAILGLWIIGGFLFVCMSEGVAIILLSYRLGIYKGKLARYEPAETELSAAQRQA